MTKKEFILETLLPYFKDPSTCALEGVNCSYLTTDGNVCAVGKWMKPGPWQFYEGSYEELIEKYEPKDFFKEEAFGMLTDDEWEKVQSVHDSLAVGAKRLMFDIEILESVTGTNLNELKEYV